MPCSSDTLDQQHSAPAHGHTFQKATCSQVNLKSFCQWECDLVQPLTVSHLFKKLDRVTSQPGNSLPGKTLRNHKLTSIKTCVCQRAKGHHS